MKIKIILIIFIVYQTCDVFAQNTYPLIKSSKTVISIRDGNHYIEDYWTIVPTAKPDIYEAMVALKSKKKVSFITGIDSITFEVEPNKSYNFIILLNNKDSAYTRIDTYAEPATFSDSYKNTYNNKTVVDIPEIYELINIILALTDKGLNDSNLVIHNSHYYDEMLEWYAGYTNEKIVLKFDSLLKNNFWNYFNLKMDGYSFEYDKEKIIRSKTYDRVNWGAKNNLLPFLNDLQDFSDKTNYRKFYKEHLHVYEIQIAYYRDSLELNEMQQWLNRNFPSTSYNCFKVIFSPLVGYSQSANWFENNGFKEAQAHVNFPYMDDSDSTYSAKANILRNQSIVFTEINHAFINPEMEKYINNPDFRSAFKDLNQWETENSPAAQGYTNFYACFNEYMNWSLVSLRYMDFAPANELDILINKLEKHQKEVRGFIKFPEFNRNLMKLYGERKKGETIADLYPAIIKWCKDQMME